MGATFENLARPSLERSGGEPRTLSAEETDDLKVLARLLREPPRGREAEEAAAGLLRAFRGLHGVGRASEAELRLHGLAEADLANLRAAFQLAERLARARILDRKLLDRPEAVAHYLTLRYFSDEQELLGALYLDVSNRLLAEEILCLGSLDRIVVDPRLIFKKALEHNAHAMILWHNHPSGDPAPSRQDLRFTRRISQSADLLGLRLVDHLILGGEGRCLSLRRRGSW